LLLLPSGRAWAHAVLVSSFPSAGGTVPAGKTALVLRFNSRVDPARSRLILLGPSGTQTTLTVNPGGEPDTLSATAILLDGGQTLRWQVLATDGHITRGEILFKAVRN